MLVRLDWSCASTLELAGFRVYATPENRGNVKGELVATAKAEERSVTFEMAEGAYIFRVIAYGAGGAERAWDGEASITEVVPGMAVAAPSAPAAAAVLPVEPSVSAVVVADPPPGDEAPTTLQVIEGPDEFRGKVVGEVEVQPQGGRGEGARLPSARIPLEGSGRSGTRSLLVAARSRGGARGGAATAASAVVPERHAFEGVLVAEIDTGGGTKTGFGTPTAADLYEYSTSNGMVARRLLTQGSASLPGIGAVGTAAWWTTQRPAPYVQRFVVESDEKDLGAAIGAFVLECYDEVQRSSATGAVTGGSGVPVQALNGYRAVPGGTEAARDADTDGPAWLARNVRADGKPRRPVRNVRWEYVVGASSPVDHADGDYKPYVPGAWLSGRYVRVRLIVEEPTGFHQLKTGAVSVYARVPILRRAGSGTPEGSVAAPPRSRYLDTATGMAYQKATGQGATGWQQVQGGGVFTGTGSPEGVVTADPGSLYRQMDGASGGALWNKRSGVGTNTGWHKVGHIPHEMTGVKTSTYSVAYADMLALIPVDASLGAVTVNTLALAANPGFAFALIKLDASANAVIFEPSLPEAVNGAASVSLTTQFEVMVFARRTSTSWAIVGHYNPGGVSAHASTHEDGGADEIDVTGLSGLLADAQTPTAHKTSHQSGGSDAIKLDDLAAPDDNTDLDVSASKHGLTPKAPNQTHKFLRGDGSWNTAPGRLRTVTVLSGSGTHSVAATTTLMIVKGKGGGAGGGGVDGTGSQAAAAGGGGEGAELEHVYTSPGSSYSYAVGVGGAGGAAGNNPGSNGGDTTFGALTAAGGVGGQGQAAATGSAWVEGGEGGVCSGSPTNGDAGAPGGPGGHPSANTGHSGSGGGRGGGRARTNNTGGSGAGRAATGRGAGGGGAFSTDGNDYAGGDGSAGYLTVYEYE